MAAGQRKAMRGSFSNISARPPEQRELDPAAKWANLEVMLRLERLTQLNEEPRK